MLEQTENQRLKILMKELGFKTQTEFAEKLEIEQGTLSGILTGKTGKGVSSHIKAKLKLLFKVNISWLNSGEGEHFLGEDPIKEEGVPYYPVNFFDHNYGNSLVSEVEPEYLINYQPFNDCTAYVPVYGDSMYPRYASGEVIAVKEIKNFDVIQWGEAYVVITNENANGLRSIKTLHEHSDPKKLILKSSNPNFKGETVIKKEDILSLYVIRGKITRNMI
jgi:phage repressor protein C with HTH and peptisase S24 domain